MFIILADSVPAYICIEFNFNKAVVTTWTAVAVVKLLFRFITASYNFLSFAVSSGLPLRVLRFTTIVKNIFSSRPLLRKV